MVEQFTETIDTSLSPLATKQVVKVIMRGAVTSFRYPHFVQGVQPTYEMPPPSTIYGHLCSAAGYFVPFEEIEFAIHFTYGAKQRDIEHTHLNIPYIQANPIQRELLFFPRLTLYIAPVEYLQVFEAPHYPVVLGRSQDLMTYESTKIVTLQNAREAYFEHTLIAADRAFYFDRSIAVTMARFIQPENRQPEWGHYAIIKDRVLYPPENLLEGVSYPSDDLWIDTDPEDEVTKTPFKGRYRGLFFQRFTTP